MKKSSGSHTHLGFPAWGPRQDRDTCLPHKVPGSAAHGKEEIQAEGCLDA